MNFRSSTILLIAFAHTSMAFSPQFGSKAQLTSSVKSSVAEDDRPRWDPLGLYGKNSVERKTAKLQPLEAFNPTPDNRIVTDPLNLYTDGAADVDQTTKVSPSLPFLSQPGILTGVPGDRGFDPFNFASSRESLEWYRLAELKHARLAMLATVGWFSSELLNGPLARLAGSPMLLDLKNRVPSVLNGGLGETPGAFWAATLGVAFAIETFGQFRSNKAAPGDLGFDPLKLFGNSVGERLEKLEAELFNGRLAMLAITAFAASEWWTQLPISSPLM